MCAPAPARQYNGARWDNNGALSTRLARTAAERENTSGRDFVPACSLQYAARLEYPEIFQAYKAYMQCNE